MAAVLKKMNKEIVVGSNQPYLFPYIAYWQLINLADIFVISDSMQYIKKGYINRNNFLLNGQSHRFSLEVLGVHENTLISEVNVGRNGRKILATISHAYKKAPFFKDVFPMMEDILLNDEKNLARYIGRSIIKISHYLAMDTQFIYLSELQGETTLKAQARTVDICKKVDASQYVNAIGGRSLYDKETFLEEGMDLSFLKTDEVKYKQYYNEFVPNLSIIDVLMFNSKESIKEMLKAYTLV